MADFCRRALAYITEQPVEAFRKKNTVQLGEMLLRHLQERPWLFVFDGLERVLVAYHRFDAAQVIDEEAGASDQIVNRDPRAAIRPEDDDLLRALAGASPSKLIISSRLVPRALLNPASQPIPGVVRVLLPGLRPADAEALIRACGVTGTSQDIQHYLMRHCDCHPLVTGVLAGLINDYLPDRGNFDAWANDANYGGQLNLADLDLIQKRNHILHAALAALPDKSRQLLSTLALVSEAVDYATLSALNPHLPPEPEEVQEPVPPERHWLWEHWSEEVKQIARMEHEEALKRRKKYEAALNARLETFEFLSAPQELSKTVRDLERRGLLQYDQQTKRHDLHPVVRGIAAGGLQPEEKRYYGQRVVDHFSRQAHNPYEEAETLEDLRNGLHIVRTLLHMGRYKQACESYSDDLASALSYNLEAHAEMLSLIRPFFSPTWEVLPPDLDESERFRLVSDAASALTDSGDVAEGLNVQSSAMVSEIEQENWENVALLLNNICLAVDEVSLVAKQDRYSKLALDIATLIDDAEELFLARLLRFDYFSVVRQINKAEAMWKLLDGMGRDWSRTSYLPGNAESAYAWFCLENGTLREEQVDEAQALARVAKNRLIVRSMHQLRGQWHLEHKRWSDAAESFSEAVQMARAVGQSAPGAETGLALAKLQLGALPNAVEAAEQLAASPSVDNLGLAELWLAIGNRVKAKKYATQAYEEAWADGEPYVLRYDLNKARDLLVQLKAKVPNLPPYNASEDEKLPWEDALTAAVEKLRPEKKATKRKKTQARKKRDR